MSTISYEGYAGKSRTDSNLKLSPYWDRARRQRHVIGGHYGQYCHRCQTRIEWHRPQSATSRVEEELIQKSERALVNATDPLERLRLLALSRGSSGIMALGRIFRRMDKDGSKKLNKAEYFAAIKKSGLDFSDEDAKKLFATLDTEGRGFINIEEFINQIHPPMSGGRRSLVQKAFHKLDKAGKGTVPIEEFRRVYKVTANPNYMSGDDSEELTMTKFLSHFETEATVDGQVTMEEFMAYYSGISVSIEDDGFFDLMMRQAFRL